MASDLEFTPEGVAADVNIDLEGLVDEMSAAKLEFDRFANSHEAALAAREAAFRDSVATFEESKKALTEELSTLTSEEASARTKHNDQKRDISETRAQIAQLRVEEQSLPAHVEVLKAEETKQLENIAAATAAANEKQKEHTFELNQLTRGIVFYKRLGLELESVQASDGEEGRMRMVFTRLDPRNPAREFSFTLGVNEDNEFILRESEPALGATAELSANLRADANLQRFTVGMRKKFKQLVRREMAEHK